MKTNPIPKKPAPKPKKPKLEAFRLWAHPGDLVNDGYSNVRLHWHKYPNACEVYIRVAVIPLDDPVALVFKADAAFRRQLHGKSDVRAPSLAHRRAMRAALTAIGVLPPQRKKGGHK
jgi:hypothetical protein